MQSEDSTLYEPSLTIRSRLATLEDDFELVDHELEQNAMSITGQDLAAHEAVLVSVIPPRQPPSSMRHVPCDIVLVIDVSGSMSWSAPLPDVQDTASKESSGLSILDLTKHAARTILETLNEGDRLGIVTFSTDSWVVQRLIPMTPTAKEETNQRISNLFDQSATNLWAGITTGLDLFREAEFNGSVQGLFILTDGMPNHMCPPQGYMTKLKPMLEDMAIHRPCVPTIHTFGFGYDILSGLLQGIAEVGHGNYAFIPDAGMIGTVFVHAVANLYSTHATALELTISTSDGRGKFECDMGLPTSLSKSNNLIIKLGNIQYGQSRNIIVSYRGARKGKITKAEIIYKLLDGTSQTLSCTASLSDPTTFPTAAATYHLHRAQLCRFLSTLCQTQDKTVARRPLLAPDAQARAVALSKSIQNSFTIYPNDPNISSLLQDLLGDAPAGLKNGSAIPSGQLYQALLNSKTHPYYPRWGAHYLPSLLHAHRRQMCNSFKDPGPLRHGSDSPLFKRCRDELDTAFDNLPPPKPSIASYTTRDHTGRTVTHRTVPLASLSRYNRYDNPCFLGSCLVTVLSPNGTKVKIPIRDLQPRLNVFNPLTNEKRTVLAVLRTETQPGSLQKICRVDNTTTRAATDSDTKLGTQSETSGLWITAYHPIHHNGIWKFPHEIATETRLLLSGEAVYSVLLSASPNPDSHTIEVEDIPCVTLGHGLIPAPPSPSSTPTPESETIPPASSTPLTTPVSSDVRTHPFFGSHTLVTQSLTLLPHDTHAAPSTAHHRVSAGLGRDSITGLANGFVSPPWESFYDHHPKGTRERLTGSSKRVTLGTPNSWRLQYT